MKPLLEGHSKEHRARNRQALGTLRQLTVQPQTRKRYSLAKEKFYAYARSNSLSIPTNVTAFDDMLADYIEHLWSIGEGRALASDTVAAFQDTEPRLKGKLQVTWRLLKTWHVNEVPSRAPPLPEECLFAMLGWCLFHKEYAFGLSLLLGFYGLLRTGEILGLCNHHILMTSLDKPAVISLGLTKSGKRTGAAESVTISVTRALQWLWAWKHASAPHSPLTPKPHQWRGTFSECMKALNLEPFEFRPYSLRRGGATCWFGRHGSPDRIIVLGRWAAVRTARLYINEGLALLATLKIPKKSILPYLRRFHQHDLANLPRTLERAKAVWGKVERRVLCVCGGNSNFPCH